jgi:hypothetical protein
MASSSESHAPPACANQLATNKSLALLNWLPAEATAALVPRSSGSARPAPPPGRRFYTREAAITALDRLQARDLADFPGHKVRVQPSQSKNKLFVGGIPHELTREGLKELLDPIVKGARGRGCQERCPLLSSHRAACGRCCVGAGRLLCEVLRAGGGALSRAPALRAIPPVTLFLASSQTSCPLPSTLMCSASPLPPFRARPVPAAAFSASRH